MEYCEEEKMKRNLKKMLSAFLALVMVFSMIPQWQNSADIQGDDQTPYNLSEGRPVYVSSGNNEENIVDGKTKTMWQANVSDENEWFYVDLGKVATIDNVFFKWEAAYAKGFDIQLSDNGSDWETVYSRGKNKNIYEQSGMEVKYSFNRKLNDGRLMFNVDWPSTANSLVSVYVDGNIANAADAFRWEKQERTTADVSMTPGVHTMEVVLYDKNNPNTVLKRGSIKFLAEEVVEQNYLDQNLEETLSTAEWTKKTGRYIKLKCTQRALNYGMAIFEFQVNGVGGANKRPVNYGTNIALNKTVQCSGTRDEWWMKDEEGNIKPDAYNGVKPENAVDGNKDSGFTSYQGDDQWLYVDLGRQYTIGRVITKFSNDAGKIYDYDISADGENWTTIHRNLKGYPSIVDNYQCYRTNVRYVRVFAHAKVESGSGVGINELEVYEYKEGDPKQEPNIPELPTRQIINNENGKGSYISGEIKKELNKLPAFVNEEKVKVPIDSNSWWSSAMIKTFGNVDCIHPMKAVYSTSGLGVLLASAGWVDTRKKGDLGAGYRTETKMDFNIYPESYMGKSGYDRVEGYGDYSVDLGLCDEDGLKMVATLVKGSPYIFTEYTEDKSVYISASSIKQVFGANGDAILTNAGDQVTTDHIGIVSQDDENTLAGNEASYFCLSAPANTKFEAVTVGLKKLYKVTFPGNDKYISIGAMTAKNQMSQIHQHAYAKVTKTHVGYTYNSDNSKIETRYTATTKLVRSGFSNETFQAFYPHQWKYSEDTKNPTITYPSIRGDMKGVFKNEIKTVQQFKGLLPTFSKPNSDYFNSSEMKDYINTVANELGTDPNADAYWQGKAVHPLAITALMADQIGETETRDVLLKKLKKIMVDWFTYSGGEDRCYFIYNKDWGTLYYPESSFGANAAICDHHFTYGYFMFGASVLATYDRNFYNEYHDMIELLVRDYANPEEPENDGNMFCKFRAFDQYSGHSWAGGYADNNDGNNQESASESLFSWVGMYLWGEASKSQKYIDAGAYGFTTEMEAILQYWFDYDDTNWLQKYKDYFKGTGQIYGATYSYGTFFGGEPLYVYGIQWLPISEYLTNYGMNQAKCAEVYQGLWDETNYAIQAVRDTRDIKVEEARNQGKSDAEIQKIIDDYNHTADNYTNPDKGWQHITWPFLSQTDPARAYNLFEGHVEEMQKEDRANTLWFVSAMDQLGYRTDDYVITGATLTGSVYKKVSGGKTTYTGEVWNPTQGVKTVKVVNPKTGAVLGKAKVGSKGLVQFEIKPEGGFLYVQNAAPTIKATGLTDGEVRNNISGTASFEDTQVVELSTSEENAKIYYTTDGSAPSTKSPEYKGKFIVSSDTTVKAITVKEGNIDSAYASVTMKIDGDEINSGDNLALGKTVKASSVQDKASNIVDGDESTSWQGEANNNEWIQVDLGATKAINAVNIKWEAAFASKYEIQVSTDGETWETVKEETGTAGYVKSVFEAVNARYVRMQGIKRATVYGYCIFEMEVYGANQAKAPIINPVTGTYNTAQQVSMESTVKGAEIKYTTDGSEPNKNSQTYSEPFTVDKSTQIKAVTYRKGMVLSDVVKSDVLINGTLGLNKTKANIAVGGTVKLAPLTNQNVTWTSDKTGVATVNADGLVTGKAVGKATITAKLSNNVSATCEVNVTAAKHITKVEIKPSILNMKNKSSDTVGVVITPADTTDDTTVTWESTKPDVVSVTDGGTLTAKKQGTATIKATVNGITGTCAVTVGAEATVKEMITDSKYNLALGKAASISSTYPGEGTENTNVLTDGNINSNFVCTDWTSVGNESIIIDLGNLYNTSGIKALALQFVNVLTYGENYQVSLSDTGINYTDIQNINGLTYEGSDNGLFTIPLNDASSKIASTRYVKITILGHKAYGFQIREAAVLSTDMSAKPVAGDYCDNATGFVVDTKTPKQIGYTIDGTNQNGYKYFIMLDGTKVTDLINAGSYTIDVEPGKHSIAVISYYNGKVSEGIKKQVEVSDGSLRDYVNTPMNLAKGGTVEIFDIYENEGSKNTAVLTDGNIKGDKVETVWGQKTQSAIVTLPKAVSINDISEVLVAYDNQNTYPSDYQVQMSADGVNYKTVVNATNVKYTSPIENTIDKSGYTYGTVKYVKFLFNGKNAQYGYQMHEIAVMGTQEKYMPSQVEGLALSSPADGEINVSFSSNNTNGQSYRIYIDDELKAMNLASPGTYNFKALSGGAHIVKVTSLLNDIESEAVSAKISIKESAQQVTTEADGDDDDDSVIPTTQRTTTAQVTTQSGGQQVTTNAGGQVTTNAGGQEVTTDANGQEVTTNSGDTPIESVTVKPTQKPTIVVAKTAVKKATKKKSAKKIKVSLKKVAVATGYEVQISKKKKFKKKFIVLKAKVTKAKLVKKAVFTLKGAKLKGKKKLWVRARAYAVNNGIKIYGKWSKVKKAKVK